MSIPDHAEALNLFDHLKRDRQPSKYAPGADTLRITLACPACKADTGSMPILGDTTTCAGCGLHMNVTACDLRIWRDQPIAAE